MSTRAQFLGNLAWRILMSARNVGASPDEVQDLLDTFNALAIPRAYMHLRDDELHYVIIRAFDSIDPTRPETWALESVFHEVARNVDVIWTFDPSTQVWRTLKDRFGAYSVACPYRSKAVPC